MRDLPVPYTLRGTYADGGLKGQSCSVTHWTRYERHDAVVREAIAANRWMRIASVERYTGPTYGGIPLRDMQERMASIILDRN